MLLKSSDTDFNSSVAVLIPEITVANELMESCTERIIAPMSSSRSISFFAFSPIFVCSCSSSVFPWAIVRNWFSSDFTTQNTTPKITTLTALTSTTAINVLIIPFFNISNTSTCHKTMTSINANIGFKAFPQATFLLSCSIIIRIPPCSSKLYIFYHIFHACGIRISYFQIFFDYFPEILYNAIV